MVFNRLKWGLPKFLSSFGDISWQSWVFWHIFVIFLSLFATFPWDISKSGLKFIWPPVQSVRAHASCHTSVKICYVTSRKTSQYWTMYAFWVVGLVAIIAMATCIMVCPSRSTHSLLKPAITYRHGYYWNLTCWLVYTCPDYAHHNLMCGCMSSLCALELARFSSSDEAYLFIVYTVSSRLVNVSDNNHAPADY